MLTQNLYNTILRYFLFLLGIFTISLGIAFSTCSGLGITPLASLPYSLSLGFHLTIGGFMMLLNLACYPGFIQETMALSYAAWQLEFFWWRSTSALKFRQIQSCLSVDEFVKAFVIAAHKNFGKTKVALDVTLVSLSIIVSLSMLHSVQDVREGTVLAVLLVETLSRIFAPLIGRYVPKAREKVTEEINPVASNVESEIL